MNKTRYFACTLCLILTLFAQTDFAQAEKAKQIDEFMKPFVAANQFSGQVVAAENGKVIYEKAFGLAKCRLQNPEPVEHSHRHRFYYEVHDDDHFDAAG